MVEIWVADLQVPDWVEQALWDFLDDDERRRAKAFRFDHLRRRFTVAHAMLRAVLAERLGVPPQVLQFRTGAHGKPALVGDEVEFNLSHSGERALVAVSDDGPVGVDIEQFRELRDLPALARRVLSDPEHDSYLRSVDPTTYFLDAWTRKEAAVKACGEGIISDLRAVDVSKAKRLRVADGYLAAVALEGAAPRTTVQRWAPSLAGVTTSLSVS